MYILSIHPCIATNKNGCSECHVGDTELAVAYQQISAHVASDLNHRQAADMAVDAYQELGGVLVGYLRANLRCDEDAQDLAQEVYLRITRHPNISEIRSLKAFVFTIAKNLLRDKSRRAATRLSACSISADDVTLVAAGSDPLQQLEADERLQHFEAIVAGLLPACREAYILNRTYSLSYADIADYMQISVSMVEKHISAALRALRADCQVH